MNTATAAPAILAAAQDTAAGMRPILVTTKHRGVFAGLVPADQDLTATTMGLKEARMAIYWNTKRGVMELCDVGPNSGSRISLPADIPVLHDITAVFTITQEAWTKWTAA